MLTDIFDSGKKDGLGAVDFSSAWAARFNCGLPNAECGLKSSKKFHSEIYDPKFEIEGWFLQRGSILQSPGMTEGKSLGIFDRSLTLKDGCEIL